MERVLVWCHDRGRLGSGVLPPSRSWPEGGRGHGGYAPHAREHATIAGLLLARAEDDNTAGRTADWLRVDSENFAAAPVEQILSRFPGVTAAAVYAVPDPVTGDQVMAALEVPGGEFDPAAFWSFLGEQPDLGTKQSPAWSG